MEQDIPWEHAIQRRVPFSLEPLREPRGLFTVLALGDRAREPTLRG